VSYLAEFVTARAVAPLDLQVRSGLVDWVSDKTAEIQPVLQAMAVTVAIVFVVYKAVQSKLSLGTMIASALAAAVLIWLSMNITELTDIIDKDLPGGETTEPGGDPPAGSNPPANDAPAGG
jgi:hypothetical protein